MIFAALILTYYHEREMNYWNSTQKVSNSPVINDYALLIFVCMMFIGCNFWNMCCCVIKNPNEQRNHGSSQLTRNPSDNESCVESNYDSDSEPLDIQLISNNEVEKDSECAEQKSDEDTALCLSPPPPDYDSLSNY